MKLSCFKISFTNVDEVFFSGQTLQGHVTLELGKYIKVKGIRLVIRGKAFVHWAEQSMRGPGEIRFKEVRHHSASEDYFDFSQQLLNRASNRAHHQDKERVLEAGQYTYPFRFRIPEAAPSSFEGQYGYIRYWVKVTIERPWKEDTSVKKFFTIICPVDLNREPSACQPTQSEKTKRLCCLCCTSGPISASLRLPQKGYVPGEVIYVTSEVHNQSRRKIGSTTVELLMTTTFTTPKKSRVVTQPVARLQFGSLSPGESGSWDGYRLVLPTLPPSYIIGCGIMNIKYTLELRVFPEGPAYQLAVPVDILVGTVPLHSTLDRYLDMQNMYHQRDKFTTVKPWAVREGASADCSEIDKNMAPQYSPSLVCKLHLLDEDHSEQTNFDDSYKPKYIKFGFHQLPPKKQQPMAFGT